MYELNEKAAVIMISLSFHQHLKLNRPHEGKSLAVPKYEENILLGEISSRNPWREIKFLKKS